MKSLVLESPEATIRFHDLAGVGTPLVFVHGLGCASSCDYPAVARDPSLASRRAILVDLLGSGFSDRPEGFDYSVSGSRAGPRRADRRARRRDVRPLRSQHGRRRGDRRRDDAAGARRAPGALRAQSRPGRRGLQQKHRRAARGPIRRERARGDDPRGGALGEPHLGGLDGGDGSVRGAPRGGLARRGGVAFVAPAAARARRPAHRPLRRALPAGPGRRVAPRGRRRRGRRPRRRPLDGVGEPLGPRPGHRRRLLFEGGHRGPRRGVPSADVTSSRRTPSCTSGSPDAPSTIRFSSCRGVW